MLLTINRIAREWRSQTEDTTCDRTLVDSHLNSIEIQKMLLLLRIIRMKEYSVINSFVKLMIRAHQKHCFVMISLLLFVVAASPAYGVGYETEPSFIERSVKRKILFLALSISLHKSE